MIVRFVATCHAGMMARRSAEETRAIILGAGLKLLLERGPTAGVQHIRLQEVLRTVGLSTGAAYRIWADQTDFHRDLATEMVRLRFAPPAASVNSAVGDILARGGGIDEVIRAGALDHVKYATLMHEDPDSRDTHAFLTALSLRASAGAWPELREASVARHVESVDEFVEFYSAVLAHYGRRMRTPFTLRQFAEAMAALGEGFAIRGAEGMDHPMVDIADVDEGPTGYWTLFGLTVRALIDMFTVEDPAITQSEAHGQMAPDRDGGS